MKKIFFIIIALPFAVISCTKNPNIINKEGHLRIGYMGPMTGERGNTGKVLTQSIKIAVDEFNASGGVHGIHAELIIEDTMIDVKKGIRAMNRLADDYMALGVVGAWSSTVSLAVAPIAEEKKL
jgi:branched-chain amino acid transport system substrate-binding protein